jgi:hypothetical protein
MGYNNEAMHTAMSILEAIAIPELPAMLKKMVLDGTAEVIWDPHVSGVVGFIYPGTNRAMCVVYVNRNDFELEDEFENKVMRSGTDVTIKEDGS